MTSNYFTLKEAQSKVGKRIATKVDFAGVPEGTTGKVARIWAVDGYGYGLDIAWDLNDQRRSPLIDGFSKDEYNRFLEELPGGIIMNKWSERFLLIAVVIIFASIGYVLSGMLDHHVESSQKIQVSKENVVLVLHKYSKMVDGTLEYHIITAEHDYQVFQSSIMVEDIQNIDPSEKIWEQIPINMPVILYDKYNWKSGILPNQNPNSVVTSFKTVSNLTKIEGTACINCYSVEVVK